MTTVDNVLFNTDIINILHDLHEELPDILNIIKDAGDNVMVQCPFHKDGQETKPSCGIHKETGLYHCFTCHETGTLDEFISKCFHRDDWGIYGREWLRQHYQVVEIEERPDIGYFGIKNAKFVKAFAFAKNPVFEDAYVNLNGQNQFIRVMGRNKENPLVILLHGGPSGPDGMMDYAFMDYLLDDYTYITWDQRGCGRTYYKNHASDPENKTANVDQLLDDIDELVDYACNRFKQDKVTIIGHSWGTVLATKYSHVHPEKIQKTICIGQVISFFKGDELAYYNALEKAERAGDETSSMKEAFKAYQETEDLFTLTKLRSFTQAYNKPDVPEISFLYGALSPYLGIDDMRWMFFDNVSPEKIYRNNKILVDYVFDKELK